MAEWGILFHFASITAIIALCTLGGGIGGGLVSVAAVEAINIQPRAQGEILRASIIGLALIETAAILALIVTFAILRTPTQLSYSLSVGTAHLGIAFAIGISSFFVGFASSFPVKKACLSIARQPFFGQNILNLMLITQSIIQSGVIFGFLISLFIKFKIPQLQTSLQSFKLLASGMAIGFGSIGPILGLAQFAEKTCSVVSINRNAYGHLVPFAFMSVAIIETPLIFAFIVSVIISITPFGNETPLSVVRALSAACCIGLGTLAPSLSSSKTSSAACQQIAQSPQHYAMLSQTSMFSQGLIDAAAVYGLLVSLLILFMQ